MFCIACGNRLPDTAAFCNRCGRATNDVSAAEIGGNEPATNESSVTAAFDGEPAELELTPVTEAPAIATYVEPRPEEEVAPSAIAAPSPDRQPPPPTPGTVAYRPPAADPFRGYGPTQARAFASLRTPATFLYILLGLFIVVTLAAIAADWRQTALLRRIADRRFVSVDSANQSDNLYIAAKFTQIGLLLVIPVFFVWWTRRATVNLSALGVPNPKFSPGWAIGWWFIPVANLFQPLRVLEEAWRSSDPGGVDGASQQRKSSSSILMICWWLAYVAALLAWPAGLSFRGSTLDREAEKAANATAGVLALDAATVILAALTILVVFALTMRQDTAYSRTRLDSEPEDQFIIGG